MTKKATIGLEFKDITYDQEKAGRLDVIMYIVARKNSGSLVLPSPGDAPLVLRVCLDLESSHGA